jgi:hypothetical protein
MGGGAKPILGSVGRGVSGLFTLGGSEIARNNLGKNNVVSKGLQTPGMIVTGGQSGGYGGGGGPSTPAPTDPFTLDPNQLAGDQNAINAQGQSQYDATLKGIGDVSTANTQRAKDLFGQMLPDIAENSQAAHLYDSTGYGQEVARQQSSIASSVANDEAQKKLGALGSLQGFQTGALQRGLSLEDFTNQAKLAKLRGLPQVPLSGHMEHWLAVLAVYF